MTASGAFGVSEMARSSGVRVPRRPRGVWRIGVCLFVLFAAWQPLCALSYSNRYRSPRNAERRLRPATRLIILHTTEAHARSSLNKLSERGEAHYCLTEDGTAYRIIDRDRVAFHAGRSMWNGQEDCDNFAIGIEVVGHHDKPMSLRQLHALRDLVGDLKKLYGIGDAQVICHSHVAYGAPNRYHPCRHRGRKRCGMLFSMWSVRRILRLGSRPKYDPDIRAGRLKQGDTFLEGVLYGATDTMAAHYSRGRDPGAKEEGGLFSGLGKLLGLSGKSAAPEAKSAAPPASSRVAKKTAPAPAPKPAPKPVTAASAVEVPGSWRAGAKLVAASGAPQEKVSKAEAAHEKSVAKDGNYYLLPDGRFFLDDRLPASVKLPPGTRRLTGYQRGGPLGPGKSAYGVVGKAWNAPTTFYVMGGRVFAGDRIAAKDIIQGTLVFYRRKENP